MFCTLAVVAMTKVYVQPGKKIILSGLFFKHVSLLLKEVHLEWQNLAAWRDFSFFSEIIDKLLKGFKTGLALYTPR